MQIDESKRNDIITNLELGMPLAKVADLVIVSLDDIQTEMDQEPAFKAAVDQAIAKCMAAQLKKLERLENWQAIAFLLQSLWPARFGRRSRGAGRRRVRRPPGRGEFDRNNLTDDEHERLRHLLAKAHGRIREERDDQRVPRSDGERP